MNVLDRLDQLEREAGKPPWSSPFVTFERIHLRALLDGCRALEDIERAGHVGPNAISREAAIARKALEPLREEQL